MPSLLRRLRSLYLWRGQDFSVRLHLRQPFVLLALPLAVVWYLARPTPVALMAVFALAALVFFAYLWAREMAFHLTAQRRLVFTALQVGDQLEEIITLRNNSFLPALYIEFHDRSTFPDYSLSSVRAADGYSQQEWHARAICTRRGVFNLGPWELSTGDPFGIFGVTHRFEQQAQVLVYPPLASIPPALLPRGRVQGDERPLHQPNAAESLSAISTRPFQPGDPLRRLHWPTTARKQSPYVKAFQPEASTTIWLAPDLDAAVQAGTGAQSTLETTVILLATLTAHLLKQRTAVGLLVESPTPHSPASVILPQRGQDHFWFILRALAALQAVPDRPFAHTLTRARSLLTAQDRLLAITPSQDTAWIAPLHAINRGSQQRAEVLLLERSSFEESTPAAGQSTHTAQGKNKTSPARAFALTLAELGIPAQIVRRGDLSLISGLYGDIQRWEFTTGGTGRAFARRAPRSARLSPYAKWEHP